MESGFSLEFKLLGLGGRPVRTRGCVHCKVVPTLDERKREGKSKEGRRTFLVKSLSLGSLLPPNFDRPRKHSQG